MTPSLAWGTVSDVWLGSEGCTRNGLSLKPFGRRECFLIPFIRSYFGSPPARLVIPRPFGLLLNNYARPRNVKGTEKAGRKGCRGAQGSSISFHTSTCLRSNAKLCREM